MNYKDEDVTRRAETSPLWQALSEQKGQVLPYLIERYLLLENWRYDIHYDLNYVHLLLAEVATVILNQEARIRALESRPSPTETEEKR